MCNYEINKLLYENKILRKIISLVREETRLVRFSKGVPYNTPKKEIFYKFINIQKLLKGNYPFLSTDKYIDDVLNGNVHVNLDDFQNIIRGDN